SFGKCGCVHQRAGGRRARGGIPGRFVRESTDPPQLFLGLVRSGSCEREWRLCVQRCCSWCPRAARLRKTPKRGLTCCFLKESPPPSARNTSERARRSKRPLSFLLGAARFETWLNRRSRKA